MFNLESTITEWREQMLAAGITGSALEELESHLCEEITRQTKAGLGEGEAFSLAFKKVGTPGQLNSEFNRAGGFMGWLGGGRLVLMDRILALLWLVYSAGGFYRLGVSSWPVIHAPDARINEFFWLMLIMEGIYLRGTIASVLLFCGVTRERRMLWWLAMFEVVGVLAVIVFKRVHVSTLTPVFTVLGVVSLWLWRPRPKAPMAAR